VKAYAFPQSRHRRTQTPAPFVNYRSYKPALRVEFERKCVYCREADGLKGDDNFGVDHYRPKGLFPHLATVYENLFYSCNVCNRRKSWFWPSAAHLEAKQFIPNPCDHVMSAHLRFHGVTVLARTAAGQFTRDLLDLNEERVLYFRWFRLRVIGEEVREERRLVADIRALQRRLARSQSEETTLRLNNQIDRFMALLAEVRRRLAFVLG